MTGQLYITYWSTDRATTWGTLGPSKPGTGSVEKQALVMQRWQPLQSRERLGSSSGGRAGWAHPSRISRPRVNWHSSAYVLHGSKYYLTEAPVLKTLLLTLRLVLPKHYFLLSFRPVSLAADSLRIYNHVFSHAGPTHFSGKQKSLQQYLSKFAQENCSLSVFPTSFYLCWTQLLSRQFCY